MKNARKFLFYVVIQFVVITLFFAGSQFNFILTVKADVVEINDSGFSTINLNSNSEDNPAIISLNYELQQSEAYGSWNNNYNSFNCYSYAIDLNDYEREPGYMFGEYVDYSKPISYTAQLVKNDLLAIGYNDVKISSTMPTILYSNQKLICVRQTTTDSLFDQDFHFMKYHPDGDYWTHKPGYTMVLKYTDVLSNDVPWIREGVYENGTPELFNDYAPYDSDIYYITYDVLGFTIDNNGILTNYTPPSNFNGSLTLPNVTGIGANAFANLTQLTNVTLPNTVTTIGANAFWGCTNLQHINIPVGVTQIGDNAFSGCTNLSTIIISSTVDNPSVLTSIGANAFWGCSNLQHINIPASATLPSLHPQNNYCTL